MTTKAKNLETITKIDSERTQDSLWGLVWRRFRRHKLAMAGMFVLVTLVLMVIFGPIVYNVDPEYIDITLKNLKPSLEHPFGTDSLGRDMLARCLVGGRISLAVGFAAMLISMFVGTLIGVLSGFFSSLDGILMRITDIFFALPLLPLLMVIILLFRDNLRNLFGPETGIFLLIVFVIGILGWMPTARLVRGEVLSIKEQEFITAVRSLGSGQFRIIMRHVLPNVLSIVMVSATFGIATAIITESALSFLGLGFPPDFPTWGRILFDAKDLLRLNPALVLWPGILISITVLSVNFIGDGLRDALDPRSVR